MSVLAWNMLRVSVYMIPALLLLLLVVPRLGRRSTPGTRCLIWLTATLRLLIPFHLSLGGILPRSQPVANLLDQIDENPIMASLLNAQQAAAYGTRMEQAGGGATLGPNILLSVWAIGAALVFCWSMAAHYMTARRLHRWSVPITDASVAKQFAECKSRYGVTATIGLYWSSQTNTPLLVGLFRPRIYLPNRKLSDSELTNVLAHELCHYRRKDLWFKLAMLLVKSIHWFNPAVHMMLRHAELDMEIWHVTAWFCGTFNRLSERCTG